MGKSTKNKTRRICKFTSRFLAINLICKDFQGMEPASTIKLWLWLLLLSKIVIKSTATANFLQIYPIFSNLSQLNLLERIF